MFFRELAKKLLENRILIILILVGLFVRLLFMPSATFIDLLSSTWREMVFVNEGRAIVSNMNEFIVAIYMKAFSPLFLPLNEIIGIFRETAEPNLFKNALPTYDVFVTFPHAPRMLFLLKIPYLLFDLGVLYLSLRFFSEDKKKKLLVAIWAFGLPLIFAAYIWGRFETLPVFFGLLAFYFAYKNPHSYWPAMLSLAIAAILRGAFAFTLPAFLLYFFYQNRQRFLPLISFVLSYLVVGKIFRLIISAFRDPGFLSTNLSISNFSLGYIDEFILTGRIGIGPGEVSLFIFLIATIIYFAYSGRKKFNFEQMVYFSSLFMLAFFLSSRVHTHYIVWLMPALSLACVYRPKIIIPSIAMIIFYYFYYFVLFEPQVMLELFAPLNPQFFMHLAPISSQQFFMNHRIENIIIVARSLFSILVVFIMFLLIRKNENKLS